MNNAVRRTCCTFLALAGLAFATPAAAQAPECGAPIPPSAHLPDLVNIVPHHVHVQEQRKRHRLMFTTALGNIGRGPMELAPTEALDDPDQLVGAVQNLYSGPTNASSAVCARTMPDEVFTFHEEHNHWHLIGINGFVVYPALDDGSGGAWNAAQSVGSLKESFCLIDYVPMDDEQLAEFGLTLPRREYFDCFGVHGISAGWVDYYHHATHGQYVDITGAAAGTYYLVLTANPDGLFLESDYSNNRTWVSFELQYNNANNAIATVLHDSLTQAGEGMRPPTKTNR